MVDIIGVNHCAIVDRQFSSQIIIPEVTPEVLNFLQGKRIGTETVGIENRLDLLRRFYFPNGEDYSPNKIMNLYNPLSQEYFHQIQLLFPESKPLDSYKLWLFSHFRQVSLMSFGIF
jgi:hypothetical protein